MLLMGPGFNFTRSNISQKDSSIFKKVKPHQGTECGCSQRNMSESRIEVLLEPHTAESNGQKGYINDMFPLHKVKIISTSRRHKISNHLFVGTRCSWWFIKHGSACYFPPVVPQYFSRWCCRSLLYFNLSSVFYNIKSYSINHFGKCPVISKDPTVMCVVCRVSFVFISQQTSYYFMFSPCVWL